MTRINLRDVPDDVYAKLSKAAEDNHQSLNSFVVERLTEVADVVNMADYLASYAPPRGTGVTLDDSVAAVREVRDAS